MSLYLGLFGAKVVLGDKDERKDGSGEGGQDGSWGGLEGGRGHGDIVDALEDTLRHVNADQAPKADEEAALGNVHRAVVATTKWVSVG